MLKGWTCCNAFLEGDEKFKGCKQSNHHKEDENFTRCMQMFPFDPQSCPKKQVENILTTKVASPTLDKLPADLSGHPNFFEHRVTSADTLQGLAIRYNTTTETIRRVNRMKTNDVFERKTVFIPKSNDYQMPIETTEQGPSRGQLLNQFVFETKCSTEEARFYLEDADWDTQQAIAAWKDDQNWQARTLAQNSSSSISSAYTRSDQTTRLC